MTHRPVRCQRTTTQWSSKGEIKMKRKFANALGLLVIALIVAGCGLMPGGRGWVTLIDGNTGMENWKIEWAFRVGDRIKIRLLNDMDQDHPMHHPFHIHGAGRFLVLARDGVVEPNLAWKDTVLIRSGETVDIVLDVTNPGLWMAHCHIAEHNQSGMMFSFNVARRLEAPRA